MFKIASLQTVLFFNKFLKYVSFASAREHKINKKLKEW